MFEYAFGLWKEACETPTSLYEFEPSEPSQTLRTLDKLKKVDGEIVICR